MSNFEQIIDIESEKMQVRFNEASKKYGASIDIGQHREQIVAEFLREYFPVTYNFGKGEIVDSYNNRSNPIDIIICNQYHPFSISKTDLGVFFAEGIAAAIDVKSDLASTSELERSLKQIQTVKKLKRKN